MEVRHRRQCPVGDNGAGVLIHVEHGAFQMVVAINETGSQVAPLQVYHLPAFGVVANAGYAAPVNGDVALLNLAGERVHDTGVGKHQVGWGITTRHGYELLHVQATCPPVTLRVCGCMSLRAALRRVAIWDVYPVRDDN